MHTVHIILENKWSDTKDIITKSQLVEHIIRIGYAWNHRVPAEYELANWKVAQFPSWIHMIYAQHH